MSDSKKTKKELIEELEALRAKVKAAEHDSGPIDGASTGGMTRRELLSASAWIAPVILTVPFALKPQQVAAQNPTTVGPTAQPTTAQPTTAQPPTAQPPTTPRPTQIPTPAPGVTQAPPSPFPSAAPTVIPVELSKFEIS